METEHISRWARCDIYILLHMGLTYKVTSGGLFLKILHSFWLHPGCHHFVAILGDWESRGRGSQSSCATGATVWISQTFRTNQNYRYLLCWSGFLNPNFLWYQRDTEMYANTHCCDLVPRKSLSSPDLPWKGPKLEAKRCSGHYRNSAKISGWFQQCAKVIWQGLEAAFVLAPARGTVMVRQPKRSTLIASLVTDTPLTCSPALGSKIVIARLQFMACREGW